MKGMSQTVVVQLHVTPEVREKMKRLAPVAHALGLIERPTTGALIQQGLNIMWDECQRIWLQTRDQKGGG